jgi:DNA polymerase-3 subunit alpha
MTENYTVYHLHTMYSLLDSSTHFEDYVDKAKELGMKAIGCSEHGNTYGWLKKKMYAEKNGLKFLFNYVKIVFTQNEKVLFVDFVHHIVI